MSAYLSSCNSMTIKGTRKLEGRCSFSKNQNFKIQSMSENTQINVDGPNILTIKVEDGPDICSKKTENIPRADQDHERKKQIVSNQNNPGQLIAIPILSSKR